MKKGLLLSIFLLLIQPTYAWNHSISLGYGYSQDPNHKQFNNSGFLLSADLIPIYRSPWISWTLNGSAGQWHTSTPVNQNLTSAAISLFLRAYLFEIAEEFPFYFLGAAGPAWISNKQFGLNTQASNITIQSNLGLGIEWNKLDLNLRLQHFSNANLAKPNEGFNILFLFSVGYLFDL